MPLLALLRQSALGQESGDLLGLVVFLALVAVTTAALWRLFRVAGQPGWAAVVPIYNVVVLLRIAGRSAWWTLLAIVPFVNLLVMLLAALGISRRFGHGVPLAIGLWLLPFVFYPMLAITIEAPVARPRVSPA